MKKKTLERANRAINALGRVNTQMIKAIEEIVKDSDEELSYEETIDESCGYTETRYVCFGDDGDLEIQDEDGNTIYSFDDMTADEIFNILVGFAHE